LRAYIVVDLGFGDCGKGLLTDFLARQCEAGLVVRYNGGAQAGHNVVTPDGRQHTFSQFGSGTFIPGVKTYLSKHVVVHPGALLVEGDILVKAGVGDAFARIRVSDQALMITPFHQAANHIREIGRGENRHGSCGVGVGEAVEDALAHPDDCVRAGDLADLARLRRKLRAIRERKRGQLVELYGDQLAEVALAREWKIFEREDVVETWIASLARIGELGLVAPDGVLPGWLRDAGTVIFEGAQGVLLDAEAGFHPYTTWSNCTGANSQELIRELAPGSEVFQIGVMRSYAVRHGPGPLPTETDLLTPVISEHNTYNKWQGAVRYGWFDGVLARYAMEVAGGVDALAVTHIDVVGKMKRWRYCREYRGMVEKLRMARGLTMEERAKVTQMLQEVAPVIEDCDAEEGEVAQKIEELVGVKVGIVSRGPRAGDVKIVKAFPR